MVEAKSEPGRRHALGRADAARASCTTCAPRSTRSRSGRKALRDLPLARPRARVDPPRRPARAPARRRPRRGPAALGRRDRARARARRRRVRASSWARSSARTSSTACSTRSGFPRAPIPMARYGLVGIRSASSVASPPVRRPTRPRRSSAGVPRTRCSTCRRRSTAGLRAHDRRARPPRRLADGEGRVVRDRRRARVAARGARRRRSSAADRCARSTSCRRRAPSCSTSRPRQVVQIAGDRLPDRYRRRLESFRYGPGRVEGGLGARRPGAVDEPRVLAGAATVHLGGTLAEMVDAEGDVQRGRPPRAPLRAVRAADAVRPDARARGHADGLGLLPRPERLRGRHDRPHRGAGRAVRARASATGSSPGT